jgi:precorrin-6B methylase 1
MIERFEIINREHRPIRIYIRENGVERCVTVDDFIKNHNATISSGDIEYEKKEYIAKLSKKIKLLCLSKEDEKKELAKLKTENAIKNIEMLVKNRLSSEQKKIYGTKKFDDLINEMLSYIEKKCEETKWQS